MLSSVIGMGERANNEPGRVVQICYVRMDVEADIEASFICNSYLPETVIISADLVREYVIIQLFDARNIPSCSTILLVQLFVWLTGCTDVCRLSNHASQQ